MRIAKETRTESRGGRGQTTFDFQVGATIFLVSTIFVLSFSPALLEPFDDASKGDTVATDRIVSKLATDEFGNPSKPYVLDRGTTEDFFDGGGVSDIEEHLRPGQNINIALTGFISGSEASLCWDDDDRQFVHVGDAACDIEFEVGSDPADQNGVVSSRRVVQIGGQRATLRVRMW